MHHVHHVEKNIGKFGPNDSSNDHYHTNSSEKHLFWVVNWSVAKSFCSFLNFPNCYNSNILKSCFECYTAALYQRVLPIKRSYPTKTRKACRIPLTPPIKSQACSQVIAPEPFTSNCTVTWDQTATHKPPHHSDPSGGPMTGRPTIGHVIYLDLSEDPECYNRCRHLLSIKLLVRGAWNFISETE